MDSILLHKRLKEKIEAVESEVKRVIPDTIGALWANEQSCRELGPIPAVWWHQITDPGRDLLKRGGKRWRPLLMLLCAEMYGEWHLALPLTPVVEIAHNGSLIIDDIEDQAIQRRGAAAEHIKFGVDLALNAGNLMYFLAGRVIDNASFSDRQRSLLHRYYIEDMVRLHFGQGLDILWHRDHENIPKEEQYMEMCRLKTGGLSRLAARAGIIAVDGEEQLAERFGDITENFGACFQIIDDVNNLGLGVPGKKRGDDIIEGKKSLPLILYLNRYPEDKPRIRSLFEIAAGEEDRAAWSAVDELIALIAPRGCLEEAAERAQELLAKTREDLHRLAPPCPARDQLDELVELLITG
jgi:octaprenyl-diphosphate synthase